VSHPLSLGAEEFKKKKNVLEKEKPRREYANYDE
jgi:hypothetical protein